MMPPPGARRPDGDDADAVRGRPREPGSTAAAAVSPNPGRRTFQRLNRAEYRARCSDLLDLDVDVNAFLPPDTLSAGFDNIADVQSVLADAAGRLPARGGEDLERWRLGDRIGDAERSRPTRFRARSRRYVHIDGTPWGTRGGLAVEHTFPADGDYTFRVMLHGTPTGQLFGSVFEPHRADRVVDRRRTRRR